MSVSRRPGPWHWGQTVSTNSGMSGRGDPPLGGMVAVQGQQHRQIRLRHRDDTAAVAVNHGNGGPPVALPGNPPVAQTVPGSGPAPEPCCSRWRMMASLGLLVRVAVERPGLHQPSRPFVGLGHGRRVEVRDALRLNHDPQGKAVLAGELKIALIVGGHGHDRPGAVAHDAQNWPRR